MKRSVRFVKNYCVRNLINELIFFCTVLLFFVVFCYSYSPNLCMPSFKLRRYFGSLSEYIFISMRYSSYIPGQRYMLPYILCCASLFFVYILLMAWAHRNLILGNNLSFSFFNRFPFARTLALLTDLVIQLCVNKLTLINSAVIFYN